MGKGCDGTKLFETSGRDGGGESDKHALLLVSLHILWRLDATAGCCAYRDEQEHCREVG